jgi:hypothetical protein
VTRLQLNYAAASNEDNAAATLYLAASTIGGITAAMAGKPEYEVQVKRGPFVTTLGYQRSRILKRVHALRQGIKKVYASVPALDCPVTARGGMRLLTPAGPSLQYVVLTPAALELHAVLRGVATPFQLTSSIPINEIEAVNAWAGRMIGAEIASKAAFQVSLGPFLAILFTYVLSGYTYHSWTEETVSQVRATSGEKLFLEPVYEDVEIMNSWIAAVKAAVAIGPTAAGGEELLAVAAAAAATRVVRLVAEQFVLGEHMSMVLQCAVNITTTTDAAIARVSSEPQVDQAHFLP